MTKLKNKIIPESQLQEFRILKATIEIVEEENVAFKTKLADHVHTKEMNTAILDKAEYLQSQFMLMDDTILHFKETINQFLKQNQPLLTPASKALDKLRLEMDQIKQACYGLRSQLEHFVLDTLTQKNI